MKKSKRFAKIICTLSASFLLCSCASKEIIPKVEACVEIPFVDGAEGACAFNKTSEKRLVSHEEWEKMRPYMIMVHAQYWSEIKKSWKYACRVAGKECETNLESVDSLIKGLDEIISQVAPK